MPLDGAGIWCLRLELATASIPVLRTTSEYDGVRLNKQAFDLWRQFKPWVTVRSVIDLHSQNGAQHVPIERKKGLPEYVVQLTFAKHELENKHPQDAMALARPWPWSALIP